MSGLLKTNLCKRNNYGYIEWSIEKRPGDAPSVIYFQCQLLGKLYLCLPLRCSDFFLKSAQMGYLLKETVTLVF